MLKDTQPVICASRNETAAAAAISPELAPPFDHNHTVPPTSITGSTPAKPIKAKRNQLEIIPYSIARSRKVSIESNATRSSCLAWANNLTVFIFVTVSTICPVTIARAAARAPDAARMRFKNPRMNSRYPAIHISNNKDTRTSITSKSAADPTTDASANATVSIVPETTSVVARATCICFCAIRPAKSLSKNVTACPIVHRCRRDRINGNRLGSTVTDVAWVFIPKTIGRTTR